MESHMTLENQIADLRSLDSIRNEVRDLLEQGLQGLSKSYASKREGWNDPGDDVEKALLLLVRRVRPLEKLEYKTLLKLLSERSLKS